MSNNCISFIYKLTKVRCLKNKLSWISFSFYLDGNDLFLVMLEDTGLFWIQPWSAVTLGNFSYNLSHSFVVPLWDKLHAMLPSVTPVHNAGKICWSVARIIAKSRIDFYFSQWLQHQKTCETCSFQGMLHWAIFPATCIKTKLRDKLQKRLPCVTAPLA